MIRLCRARGGFSGHESNRRGLGWEEALTVGIVGLLPGERKIVVVRNEMKWNEIIIK